MAAMGRKLLPMADPRTARERFAWIVRAIRASSTKPEIRNTATFTNLLNGHLTEDLKPATVNRLETGTLDFSIERCIAYEKTLDLPYCELVDSYVWFMRHRGIAPKSQWSSLKEAGAQEIDLLVGLSREEPLAPLDWIHLAYLYRNRKDLVEDSRRLRNLFFDGLIRDMGRYYEKDQRLMREALIIVGDDVVPLIEEAVTNEPIRFFNATEALGFIAGKTSWQTLLKLQKEIPDVFAIPGILDSIARRQVLDAKDQLRDPTVVARLKQQCMELLVDTDSLFISRESSLAVIRSIGHSLSDRESACLRDLRPNLLQLDTVPSSATVREIVRDVERRFSTSMSQTRESHAISTVMPGLSRIVTDGIFARDRVERVSNGVLLAPWSKSVDLTEAIGGTMSTISAADYGAQRSMVRFVTKLGASNAGRHLRALAEGRNVESNTLLSIAWALGGGTEAEDLDALMSIYRGSPSQQVRRAVCTAALRRGFEPLLTLLSRDRDGVVAREAMIGLAISGASSKQ